MNWSHLNTKANQHLGQLMHEVIHSKAFVLTERETCVQCLGLSGSTLPFQSSTYPLHPTQKSKGSESAIIASFPLQRITDLHLFWNFPQFILDEWLMKRWSGILEGPNFSKATWQEGNPSSVFVPRFFILRTLFISWVSRQVWTAAKAPTTLVRTFDSFW